MKKCVVVDLDNTLWGGVVGEDGIDGIQLSHTAKGAGFMAFQQGLLDLYDRGVILAINSRNTEEDARAVLRSHPNMILKEDHFAAARINWNNKVDNMRELARELRIGLDSMVFLDDDPVNRASMRTLLPEVETPELPVNSGEYASFLRSLPYFASAAITDEDKMRGNLYVTERLRMQSEKEFESKEQFLESLRITMDVHIDDSSALERLAQLTEKTNQFNINKQPLTTEDIRAYIIAPDRMVFFARVADRFGDSGIVAFAIVHTGARRWHIDSLLLSCRVLQRGIEEAFLAAIARKAKEVGAEELSIGFVPSEKNLPAAQFVQHAFPTASRTLDSIESPAHITTRFV